MKADAPPDDIARLMALFGGNESAHGTHGEPDPREPGELKWTIKKTAKTLRQPVTEELWRQHLSGVRPLGVIPIREDDTCTWGSIDYDAYDVNLLQVVGRVEQAKLPLVPCVSKSGGLHLFLFLDRPEPAASVQAALKEAAKTIGMAESEIFPKQSQLDPSRGDVGNWMVMPYFGGTFDGKLRMQRGLKKSGSEMTLTEFVAAAEKGRTTLDKLGTPARPTRSKASPFADGPPCLQQLASTGLPEGEGRKRALFMMGIYAKKKHPSDWQQKIDSYNQQHNKPPLPADEVVSIQRSLRKKDYEYTCKEEPMCGVCDRATCRTRRWGIRTGGDVPVIISWRKLSSDNPVWFMTIEGSNQVLEIRRIDDITNYRRFADQCAKQLNRYFRPVKAVEWSDTLREAATKLVDEPADEEITREGKFRMKLDTFLTDRAVARRREEILGGRPFHNEDKERYEFHVQHLLDFLERSGMRDATAYECQQWIKNLGGGRVGKTPVTICGKGLRLWWVPASAVQRSAEIPPEPIPQPERDI